VRDRLASAAGNAHVGRLFSGEWPRSAASLAERTAAFARDYGFQREIRRITRATNILVSRRLNDAAGKTLLRNLFHDYWPETEPDGGELLDDEVDEINDGRTEAEGYPAPNHDSAAARAADQSEPHADDGNGGNVAVRATGFTDAASPTTSSANTTPREEYFENEPTDVEIEVTDAQSDRKPWDPSKIRISTKPFSLRQVVDMIDDKDIDLAPDFQRLYVWKPRQKWRLIESILLGIPLPAFYFNQDATGAMQVVDGVQRLTTISRFTAKGSTERLADLEYLDDLNGKTFAELDVSMKRRLQQTQIFVNVIEPQTPDEVKFDVFRRINTGGSPLTAQEIRHCMSRDASRALLKRLVELPSFHAATSNAFHREQRMADREVALRFCAFRYLGDPEKYRDFSSLDAFLLDFIRRVDANQPDKPQLGAEETERLVQDFDRAMRSAVVVFENAAFRKFPSSATKRGPLNRALFESWAVALADHEPATLRQHAKAICRAARTRMEEPNYAASTTQGTGDARKVGLRFSIARDVIASIVRPFEMEQPAR